MNAKYGSMKNPAKSCWDIYIETRKVDGEEEKRGKFVGREMLYK